MPKKILTVRDILEHFLETTDIKLVKDEEYEKVMGWYENIIAIPVFEYRQLVYAQNKLDKMLLEGNEDDE